MKRKIAYEFSKKEITAIRDELLIWYSENKRDLPWRRAAKNSNKQQHAYAVWVSEIMLQQTRVATVIDYYKKWMLNWPTVTDLAKATIEEVNEAWAGLGYYSRGRRLREGAVKVINELDGKIPDNATDLMELLPGVGRYTAAAIASIAFNESVGVLDGNVIRVLCRLLTIGGDSSSKNVIEHLWSQVNELIPKDTPGDFNQAMMELGAMVCTPKSPTCSKCPLQTTCKAYKEVEKHKTTNSIIKNNFGALDKTKKRKSSNKDSNSSSKRIKTEHDQDVDVESCVDFLAIPPENPWIPDLGVTNYPRKSDKKPPRNETALISVVETKNNEHDCQILLMQRPDSGLLAGLWEFPTLILNESQISEKIFLKHFLQKHTTPTNLTKKYICEKTDPFLEKYLCQNTIEKRTHVGELTHKFSHIHLRYIIELVVVTMDNKKGDDDKENAPDWKWVKKDELKGCAMSSAMHKILKMCDQKKGNISGKKSDRNQQKLDKFFLKTVKKEDVKLPIVKQEIK